MRHAETRDMVVATIIELFGDIDPESRVELNLVDSIPPAGESAELAGRIMSWAVTMINRELWSHASPAWLEWTREGFVIRPREESDRCP